IWQTPAGWEPLRASRHVRMCALPLVRCLVAGIDASPGLDHLVRLRSALGAALSVQCRAPRAHLLALWPVLKLLQQVPEAIGNALFDDVIVDALQNVSKPALVFAAQPSCPTCRRVRLHQGLCFRRLLLREWSSMRSRPRPIWPKWLGNLHFSIPSVEIPPPAPCALIFA